MRHLSHLGHSPGITITLLWKLNPLCRFLSSKCSLLELVLSHLSPFQTTVHYNIILPYAVTFLKFFERKFSTHLYTFPCLLYIRTSLHFFNLFNGVKQCVQITFVISPWHFLSWSQTNIMFIIIQYAVCLTTGPKPLPKRFLHIERSKASSFKWEYPLLPLRLSSSFLRLLPRLLVTSISPFIFPSITCFRRQFLLKMWPIQLAFRFRISRRIFLCSLTRSNTSAFLTWSIQLIFSILLQHHISCTWYELISFVCCEQDKWNFCHGAAAPSGPRLPHFASFAITLRLTTHDEFSGRVKKPEEETST